MGNTPEAAAQKPDPEKQKLAEAKAKFEEAVKKSKIQEGLLPADPLPVAEKPVAAADPEAPAKPAPKPKAPPKPDPLKVLQDQVAALTARLEEKAKPKAEEAVDPLDEIRGRLTERFGEDEAGDLVESLYAPMAERLERLESVPREATQHGRQNVSKANQKRLAAIHPQLKSQEAWELVHDRVVSLFEKDPKAYESADEAYDAVASTLYGASAEAEEAADEAPEETEVEASRIAAASMSAPGKAPRKETRSLEERSREHLAYILKHPEDKAGSKRLARELGLRPRN